MVKFPNAQDGMDTGVIEYFYALMALDARIEMPTIYLFRSLKGNGYFAVKRFDRNGSKWW